MRPSVTRAELYRDDQLVASASSGGALESSAAIADDGLWRTSRRAPSGWSSVVQQRTPVRTLDSSRQLLTAPTTGALEVVLHGSNFGPARSSSVHCVFVSYASRYVYGPLPVCDGVETFSGEGEVYSDGTFVGTRTRQLALSLGLEDP